MINVPIKVEYGLSEGLFPSKLSDKLFPSFARPHAGKEMPCTIQPLLFWQGLTEILDGLPLDTKNMFCCKHPALV